MTIRDWTILKREPIVDFGILALTPQKEVVMVRRYRHGTEQVCVERPGGLVDSADDCPQLSAQRELLDETWADRIEKNAIGYL